MGYIISYYESTRVGLQFQYDNQYSIVTQALVLAPENVHISLMKTDETVLNCTEMDSKHCVHEVALYRSVWQLPLSAMHTLDIPLM